MSKPVGTTADLADWLLTGFWQYEGTSGHHWGSNTITYNIDGLNAAEQFLAQSALNAWHEVANLTFVQTSGSANITFANTGSMSAYEYDGYNGAGVMSYAYINISSDWITKDGGANDGKTGIDSYGYQTYIHEIGHALGLGHQGPYNGGANYSNDALYANDTWQYSVMSYFGENAYSGSSYRYVITPQMADIYAVQELYGAATTRTGDTTYGFHNTAGSIFDFSAYTTAPALTIYDSGGNDTLDCSGYANNQTIDLHAGAFSSVGGLVHNIGIETNTIIENAVGGSGNDTLIANDAGCTLAGGAGADTLTGGASADRLVGGTGKDTMTGNGGADIFAFAAGDSSAAAGAHDLITDFTAGTDKIDLTGIDADTSSAGVFDAFWFLATAAFNGVAGALDYAFDAIRGVTVLQGDVNGDMVADFAVDLTGNLTLTADDFTTGSLQTATPVTLTGTAGDDSLTGTGLNDQLYGLAGNDTLTGNGGDDLLDGGTGADTMIGGTGNDTYVVDNAGDVVTELSGEGTDTVQASIDYTLTSEVENLTLTGSGNLNGTGNALDNVITGNSGNNVLTGGAGADTLTGNGGDDLLDGGTGADTMIGGTGNDTYVVDNAGDVVTELSGEGTDTVQASIDYTLTSEVENLTLTGSGNLNGTGNALDNVITGNSGNNVLTGGAGADTLTGNGGDDLLDGGTGADTMIGGTGNDTYVVDNAGDVVTELSGEGTDTVQASVDYTLTSDVENLTLTGSGNLNGTGNALDNVITGNSGNNVLTGGAGADTLTGNGGDDLLDGGTGADTMIGGTGNDTYVVDNAGDVVTELSGEGTDTVQSSISYTLPSGVENLTLTGSANINGTGNAADNVHRSATAATTSSPAGPASIP